MRTVKLLSECLIFAAALPVVAATVTLPEFPAPAWPEREVAIHVSLDDATSAPAADFRLLRLLLGAVALRVYFRGFVGIGAARV